MRVAASVALTALVATTLAACSFVTPQQTARSYTPSDGVNGSIGSVQIRNVFLVTQTGTDASLIGALANVSDAALTVTLQYGSGSAVTTQEVRVPANGLVSLRPTSTTAVDASVPTAEDDVTLSGIRAVPGGLYPIGFAVTGVQPVSLQVPVLNTSQPQYATLAPTPTPTPTRSRRTTPEPTESVTPGVDAEPGDSPTPTDSATPTDTATP